MVNKMRLIHPGEQLQDEFNELNMSGSPLARALGVPAPRINYILAKKRGITVMSHSVF